MEWFGIIEGVMGLEEGYSETGCTWFPDPLSAEKNLVAKIYEYSKSHDFRFVEAENSSFLLQFNHGPLRDEWREYWFALTRVQCSSYDQGSETSFIWDQLNSRPLLAAGTHTEAINICSSIAFQRIGPKTDAKHLLEELKQMTEDVFAGRTTMLDGDDFSIHLFPLPKC